MDSTKRGRVLETQPLAEGRWLRLDEITYVDRHGRTRRWETAARQQDQGAVLVIPRLQPSGRYVLIEQYRPPAAAAVLEFPAGLIDADEDPRETALRELLEETGYHGTICRMTPNSCSSPGMTGEEVILALVDIDERQAANIAPQPQLEDGEDIEVFTVGLDELPGFIRERLQRGTRLDSRAVAFFLGLGIDLPAA